MFLLEALLVKFLRHKVSFVIDAVSDFLGNFVFFSDQGGHIILRSYTVKIPIWCIVYLSRL